MGYMLTRSHSYNKGEAMPKYLVDVGTGPMGDVLSIEAETAQAAVETALGQSPEGWTLRGVQEDLSDQFDIEPVEPTPPPPPNPIDETGAAG